jgi:hypothetical protein
MGQDLSSSLTENIHTDLPFRVKLDIYVFK